MSDNLSLIYVWDAYCGWCYGFSKGLREFSSNHPELPVQVISGGLFIGQGTQPIRNYPHIPEANNRISRLTGAEFGDAYNDLLSDGNFILDSKAAAIGYAALREVAPDKSLQFASQLQHAFYYNGESLSDIKTFKRIAESEDLDIERVVRLIEDEKTADQVEKEFLSVAELGVHSYPTLLLKKGQEILPLGGGAMTAHKLEERFKNII